jgi:hypothetical protein
LAFEIEVQFPVSIEMPLGVGPASIEDGKPHRCWSPKGQSLVNRRRGP